MWERIFRLCFRRLIPHTFFFLCRIFTTHLCNSKLKNTVSLWFHSSGFSFLLMTLNFLRFVDDVSVLPKFSVKLQVPPYILKTDKDVVVQLKARYCWLLNDLEFEHEQPFMAQNENGYQRVNNRQSG